MHIRNLALAVVALSSITGWTGAQAPQLPDASSGRVVTGPRPEDGERAEGDGPDEFHVVMLDNGRSRVLGSDLAEILYCIRCGACLNTCPVFHQIGGTPTAASTQAPSVPF